MDCCAYGKCRKRRTRRRNCWRLQSCCHWRATHEARETNSSTRFLKFTLALQVDSENTDSFSTWPRSSSITSLRWMLSIDRAVVIFRYYITYSYSFLFRSENFVNWPQCVLSARKRGLVKQNWAIAITVFTKKFFILHSYFFTLRAHAQLRGHQC